MMLEAKTYRVWFGVTVLMCALSCGEALGAQEKPHSVASATEYRIHAGDVVKLDVWNHPEITRTVAVDRKGNLHLPVIHDVKASGLTAMELAGLIRQKLKSIIPDPQVTMTITEISATHHHSHQNWCLKCRFTVKNVSHLTLNKNVVLRRVGPAVRISQ